MLKQKISNIVDFAGREGLKALILSIIVGFVWFGVESSFILIIQGFMLSIGLLTNEQVFLPEWYPTSIQASVILLLLFGLLRAAGSMLKGYAANNAHTSFLCHQRVKLLAVSLKNAHLVSTREIITNFTEVINQSADVVSNCSHLITIFCTAVLFLASGFKIAPIEMLIGLICLTIFLFPLKYLTRKISFYGNGLVQEWESASNSLLRGLKNHFLLSIYNQIESEISDGKRSLELYKKHFNSYTVIATFSHSFPMFIGVLIVSIITFTSVRYIKTEPMKLIAFFYLFIRLAQSAGEVGRTVSVIKLNLPGFKKLADFHEKIKNSQKRFPSQVKVLTEKDVSIEVKNLNFSYEESKPLLQNINLNLSKSDILIIKGPSGVGKSTLLSIILGLNLPNTGEIKINGFSTKEWKLDLHQVLAYVGPEPFLIEGTVRENLSFGYEKSVHFSDEEIWETLDLMGLKSLIRSLEKGLEEPIHDIPQLSTGQKQRLSLARAILRKPALLILDEATANLDSETEFKIIENLKGIFSQCCSIIVTHKSSFDRIATSEITLKPRQDALHTEESYCLRSQT